MRDSAAPGQTAGTCNGRCTSAEMTHFLGCAFFLKFFGHQPVSCFLLPLEWGLWELLSGVFTQSGAFWSSSTQCNTPLFRLPSTWEKYKKTTCVARLGIQPGPTNSSGVTSDVAQADSLHEPPSFLTLINVQKQKRKS